jgi:uncharacterized protein
MQVNAATLPECDFWRVVDPIAIFAAHCAALLPATPAAGLAGLFLLGAAGSTVHCSAMCGPLVAGQVAERLTTVPATRLCEAHRLRHGLLLPYHAGRLTTYASLGAIAGASGLAFVGWLAPARQILLLLAALFLLAAAWVRLAPGGAAGAWSWVRRLNRTRPVGAYLFGLAMGLLPCGLLYAALVGACALATPIQGAAGMLAFGAGTTPMLAIIGIAGHTRPARQAFARAAPWLLTLNAAVLAVVAVADG